MKTHKTPNFPKINEGFISVASQIICIQRYKPHIIANTSTSTLKKQLHPPLPFSLFSQKVTPNYNLLIIERNPKLIQFLDTALRANYQLSFAKNGQLGVEKTRLEMPDLVITGIKLPMKDGFEICEELKKEELTSHIPIIMLSPKADMFSKIKGLEKGADAFMSKPFSKKELQIRVKNLILLRQKLQKRLQISIQHLENNKDFCTDAFIKELQEVLIANISNENFNISRLCQILSISRSQLHRKLKTSVGMSTSLYIRHLRLLIAKELLRNTNRNISEIAYQVGFNSLSYFSKIYKQTFGKAPKNERSGNK
jgi:YesN/AraC family two-component response regulator